MTAPHVHLGAGGRERRHSDDGQGAGGNMPIRLAVNNHVPGIAVIVKRGGDDLGCIHRAASAQGDDHITAFFPGDPGARAGR